MIGAILIAGAILFGGAMIVGGARSNAKKNLNSKVSNSQIRKEINNAPWSRGLEKNCEHSFYLSDAEYSTGIDEYTCSKCGGTTDEISSL